MELASYQSLSNDQLMSAPPSSQNWLGRTFGKVFGTIFTATENATSSQPSTGAKEVSESTAALLARLPPDADDDIVPRQERKKRQRVEYVMGPSMY